MSEGISDNVLVQRRKWGAEFLAISMSPEDGANKPYEVSLYRYCVPGRIDTYSWDWVPGGCGIGDRVRFFSEGMSSLAKAVQMTERDLERPAVVKMLTVLCNS